MPNPLSCSNASPSSIFRSVEKLRPTLLFDETDTFVGRNEDLRGVLNSGHMKSGAWILRSVGKDGDFEPRRFSTWCPKVLSGIGRLPGTLRDRSIEIPMQRKTKSDKTRRLSLPVLDREASGLNAELARWTAGIFESLKSANPALPARLNDRAADNWWPLFAIADEAGGDWPTRARAAACALSVASRDADEMDDDVQLLADVRAIFMAHPDVPHLSSETLVGLLVEMEDRPWPEHRYGKPLSKAQLAQAFRPFDVRPKAIKVDGATVRGYAAAELLPVWERYLPKPDAAPIGSPVVM